MTNSKLILFFKEESSFTQFERIRYIYDITNNLDLDLLFDLKSEYTMYLLALKTKTQIQIEENSIEIDYDKFKSSKSNIYQYIAAHLQDYNAPSLEFVKENMLAFLEQLDDLIKRKLSDLPKNSRHKNNLSYQQHVEDWPKELDSYAHIGGDELENIKINELVDLSDSSLVEKIIYLEKLGVIEFLRSQNPFNTSVNRIANVFSAITGSKSTSIQPLLNALLNDVNNSKNPLLSTKNVKAVEANLMKIGFVLK